MRILLVLFPVLLFSCKKESNSDSELQFKFRFDATQPRLNNIGQPATIPA